MKAGRTGVLRMVVVAVAVKICRHCRYKVAAVLFAVGVAHFKTMILAIA